MTEREAMDLCLDLASRGWGRVAPNPLVGAVLLRAGEMIGAGYHAEFGGDHAEVAALREAGDATGSTCVVNLEPCNHQGKTPPCSEALIAAGVSRVVYGCADPGDRAGGGAARLRAAGIDVEYSEDAGALSLNAPFLHCVADRTRPFVALKLATSIDGFIADHTGRTRWVSGVEAREFVHWLRAGFDAIAVGRKTAEQDDPQLTVRGAIQPRVAPTRVIFTRSGSLRPDLGLIATAAEFPTVVMAIGSATETAEFSVGEARVLTADTMGAGLQALRDAGCESLFVEGGGILAGSLLDAGVVDRIYWIQAPILLRSGVVGFWGGKPVDIDDAERWKAIERRSLGEDTLLVLEK